MAERLPVLPYADAWLATLRKPNTERSYRRVLLKLREYTAPERAKKGPLTPAMVHSFGKHVQAEYSANTANQHVVALRTFFRWLKEHDHNVDDLIAAIPKRVSPKHKIDHETPTIADAQQLCRPQHFTGANQARDRAVVLLAFETGASTGQIVALTCGDLDGSRVCIGDRVCQVSSDLGQALRQLREDRPSYEPLLLGARGGPLLPRIATRAVRQAAAVAGLQGTTLRGLRNAHLWQRVESGERAADVAEELGMRTYSVYRATRGRITGTDGSGYES